MDAAIKYNYWTFDLNPYIFEVKNIPFHWLTTWWGISLVVILFAAGYFLPKKFIQSENKKSIIHSIVMYALIILLALFGLQKYKVHWGLRWYSTMYLLAFLTYYFSCLYWIKNKTLLLTENLLVTLITFGIIGMLVGARLAYVFIYNWDYYKHHLWESFATWEGGLSFHGAVIGIIIVFVLFARKYKIPFLHLTDKLVLMVPFGLGIGRLGNFMNGELWGRPIVGHVPWAIIFPLGGFIPRHPSQIYQCLGEGFGLLLTLFIFSRFKQKEGVLSSLFIIFYCLFRFIVEYFRAADAQLNYFYLNHFDWAPLNSYPDTKWWQILTMGQILCFVFLIAGLVVYFFVRKNKHVCTPSYSSRCDEFYKSGLKLEGN